MWQLCVYAYREKEVCSSGRQTLLILRCDTSTADHRSSDQRSVRVQLSPVCAVGTCDGCNFVFMMRSRAACPVCTEHDFHTYKTLCVDGQRDTITEMITYVSLCVFLSVCLCLSVYLSLCLSLYLSLTLCFSASVYHCLFVYLPVSVFVSLSVCSSTSDCMSLCLCLSVTYRQAPT